MLDALKSLFENNVISEEVKFSIQEAWDAKIKENRDQVTAELREEFSKRYEHDKDVMVEAIDRMLGDRLQAEIEEFTEDRKGLAEAKARYHVAIREHTSKANTFIVEALAKEIRELHEDQKVMADNFRKLEDFVVESLAKEISEFYADKQDLAETKVRLIKEAKEQFAQLKDKFVKRSSKVVEAMVVESLSKEIGQLKEDIDQARNNDFGRKIFEAFANEYQRSHLSEKSDVAKLLKVIEQKESELTEAAKKILSTNQIVESKSAELAKMHDRIARKEIMNELLTPLGKDQREIMQELLEGVQTSKLQTSFDKYLPAVIAGETPAKRKALTEAKEITGNKEKMTSSANTDGNIIDIRRLAGLKV